MAGVPEKAEHQRRFMALDFQQRRAIIRAVNKGTAVGDRAHAGLAVNVARRQKRFWRYAWILGPMFAAVQFVVDGPETALVNGLFGTVLLAGIARFWYRRAHRSEVRNLELLASRGVRRTDIGRPSGGTPGTGKRTARPTASGGHLPTRKRGGGDDPGREGTPGGGTNGSGPPPPGHRPYRPRGGKRQ